MKIFYLFEFFSSDKKILNFQKISHKWLENSQVYLFPILNKKITKCTYFQYKYAVYMVILERLYLSNYMSIQLFHAD